MIIAIFVTKGQGTGYQPVLRIGDSFGCRQLRRCHQAVRPSIHRFAALRQRTYGLVTG